MRKQVRQALLGALVISSASSASAPLPALMPMPSEWTAKEGSLALTGSISAKISGCGATPLGEGLQRLQADLIKQTGVHPSAASTISITIRCANAASDIAAMEHEGYRLEVTGDGITLDADGPTGVLRAFATLRQLVSLKSGQPALSNVTVKDSPRFAWRGIMIDTARHFMTIDTIKRQIDAMEQVKLNILHLHLSDNEAFRVESRRYPALTAGLPKGEFYTQAQIRDLVAYAGTRGVLIVPEFDMPGHTRAIVEAYPETGIAAPSFIPGLKDVALNPASEETYRFVARLLDELIPLFPAPYFHIGGDEVAQHIWQDRPDIAALMNREGLSTMAEVEAYFLRRVATHVRKRGKTVIGWEEAAEGDLPQGTIIQAWRSSNATAKTTAKGYRTIVSAGYYLDLLMPTGFHYAIDPLDTSKAGMSPEDAARGRAMSPILAKIIDVAIIANPLPPLTDTQADLILGAEAPLWSELVTDEIIDSRMWPRAAALAERFWSPASVQDEDDMYRRLAVVENQLTINGLSSFAARDRMIRRMGSRDVTAVATLVDIVTPVRNMAHDHRIPGYLRGEVIVQPLNALADTAPVDSMTARLFENDVKAYLANPSPAQYQVLKSRLQMWRDNHARFVRTAEGNAMLEPAIPVSADIALLATSGLKALEAIDNGTEVGAEDLAAARALIARLEAAEAASWKPIFSFLGKQPPADLIVAITPGVTKLIDAAH